ncbi:MAG: hypothetical protein AAF570_13490 [Bacteroidota bacterium]
MDVVAGAVGGGYMFARLFRQDMPWAFYVVLGASVWLMYTVDHLLDAQRLQEKASTARHFFHYQYGTAIKAICVVLAIATPVLAFTQLSETAVYFGIGMGLLSLLHMVIVKYVGDATSPFLIKELGVAMVYSFGVAGLPVLESGLIWTPEALVIVGQFLLLALANLIEFSMYEVASDTRDGHTSFVRAIGVQPARNLATALLVIVAGLAVWMILRAPVGSFVIWVEAILLLMTGTLTTVLYLPDWMGKADRYRTFGDGAFLLPLLALVIPGNV